ncbi:MAG: helix-turn-helix domain-containing protein, partial [Pseudomonadota bacterium]
MPRPSVATERRAEILEAFEACALRKGLQATTLADVAEEAGLPRPLVRHFMGNRDDMVAGLIERMMERAIDDIEQALAAAEPASANSQLQIILSRTFMDPVTNRLMVQLWQQSWQDKKLHARLEDVYRRCVEQIHDRLFPEPTPTSYDLAYAVSALALGNAVFDQFNVRPVAEDALL